MYSRENLMKFRSIGGWLLFYVVLSYAGLAIGTMDFLSISGNWKIQYLVENSSLGGTLVGVTVFFAIASLVVIAIHLNFVHKIMMDKVLLFLYMNITFVVGSQIILVVILSLIAAELGVSGSGVSSDTFVSMGRVVISSLIWISYFKASKRCEIYFMDEEAYKELIEESPYLVYPDKKAPKTVKNTEKTE